MKRALLAIVVLVAIAAIAVSGFQQGRRTTTDESRVEAGPAPLVAPVATKTAGTPPPRVALPDTLDSLDGNEFVAAIPELDRRAREGDQAAALLLIHRLQECTFRAVEGVDAIRQRVDAEYERQLAIQKEWPNNGMPVIDEAWRDDRLKHDMDFRERCLALTPRALGRRLDVAELALARHERDVVVDLVRGSLFAHDAERVRYVDRLSAIADAERAEIGRLVEAGDRGAMEAAAEAYGHSGFGVIDADQPRAYAIAYALSLTGSVPQFRMDWLLKEAAGQLSPEQLDAARSDGVALHARCCAGGSRGASH
jgi:hypothetical protein